MCREIFQSLRKRYSGNGTAALEGVDDFPFGVLGGFFVGGEAELAGAAVAEVVSGFDEEEIWLAGY